MADPLMTKLVPFPLCTVIAREQWPYRGTTPLPIPFSLRWGQRSNLHQWNVSKVLCHFLAEGVKKVADLYFLPSSELTLGLTEKKAFKLKWREIQVCGCGL